MAASGLHPNIGAITVMTPSTNHTLSPQGDGTYLPLAIAGTLWSAAGATVNITGTGADYGAFSVMLPGPTSITVTNPQAGALDVPRTGDLTITWTDGTTGHVTVEIDGAAQSLSCDFVVASGSAIVPRQALSMLDAGAATMTLFVANTFLVDNVVTVSAETPALDSGGLPYVANVNLR
jgi:VCBS repeat-containing protein